MAKKILNAREMAKKRWKNVSKKERREWALQLVAQRRGTRFDREFLRPRKG